MFMVGQIVTITVMVGLVTASFAESQRVYTMISYQLLVIIIATLFKNASNLKAGLWLLIAIYRHRRLEYYNHRKGLIAILLLESACVYVFVGIMTSSFYLTYCWGKNTEGKYKDETPFFD